MKNNILELVDNYWKFDSDQYPISSWHDKQDLLKAIENELEEQLADVRNKLSPVANLIALLEKFDVDERHNITLIRYISEEINKTKEVIKYLSKK